MDEDRWYTAQFFLSNRPAVFEVQVNLDSGAVRCDCPGFRVKRACRHSLRVHQAIAPDSDELPVRFEREAPNEDASPETFRRAVVRHGRHEVA